MTVTDQKSVQVTNRDAGVLNESITGFGARLYPMVVNALQAALGSANSTFQLGVLPPGKWRYVSFLSRLRTTAFGTGRTMDIGHAAYTEPDGDAVNANEIAIHSAKDVSAVTNWVPGQGDELDDAAGEFGTLLINSRTNVTITAKVESGTVPANAQIDGILMFLGA